MFPVDRGDLPNRGSTLYEAFETIDANNLRGVGKEGALCWFEDVNPHNGKRRSGNMVLCKLVRNTSGITLYAKQNAHLQTSTLRTDVDRPTRLTSEGPSLLVDEYLPSTGVRNNDCFWAPVLGPALGLTSTTAGALNVIAAGDLLVAVTAAGTTSADAGHIATGATLGDNLLNVVGVSESTMTTANSGADLLLFVNNYKY
jgi:hypothetical protein